LRNNNVNRPWIYYNREYHYLFPSGEKTTARDSMLPLQTAPGENRLSCQIKLDPLIRKAKKIPGGLPDCSFQPACLWTTSGARTEMSPPIFASIASIFNGTEASGQLFSALPTSTPGYSGSS
jgi:hypothetical protein